jgi:hypothetical protein
MLYDRPLTRNDKHQSPVTGKKRLVETLVSGSGSAPSGRQVALICAASSASCLVLLVLFFRLWRTDLYVPFRSDGDALFILSWAKGILEGNWSWKNPRLGVPLGADWRDFLVNMPLEALTIRIIGIFSGSPGLAVNLAWLLGILGSSGSATFALLRLGARMSVAPVFGIIYALQPFVFYHGVPHLNLAPYLVPLLAAGCIEILASGSSGSENWLPGKAKGGGVGRHIPAYFAIGCVLQGLSYIYYSFFTVFLTIIAAALAVVVHGWRARWRMAVAALLLVFTATSVSLTPWLTSRVSRGPNPTLSYKHPSEADIYGLKLRQLLTPIRNHPIKLFRGISSRFAAAHFPNENENAAGMLGAIGSAGLLLLLAVSLCAAAGRRIGPAVFAPILGASAALCLSSILLATVGGFGSIFNTFVLPDIRSYSRIAVFLEFFCVLAIALCVSWGFGLRAAHGIPRFLRLSALAVLSLAAAYDQCDLLTIPPLPIRTAELHSDQRFVSRIESVLPRGARLFQLPVSVFPLDAGVSRMQPYEQARLYLASRTTQWSWGGISGREGEWAANVAQLPLTDMLSRLAYAGFSGLTLNRLGYENSGIVEKQLSDLLGVQGAASDDGQFVFYDIQGYRARLLDATPPALRAARIEYALDPVETTFGDGFYGEEHNAEHRWHWSLTRSTLLVRNTASQPRTIRLSMVLQTGAAEPEAITITDGTRPNRILVTAKGSPYQRTMILAPDAQIRLSFTCECQALQTPDPRELYFNLQDLRISIVSGVQ